MRPLRMEARLEHPPWVRERTLELELWVGWAIPAAAIVDRVDAGDAVEAGGDHTSAICGKLDAPDLLLVGADHAARFIRLPHVPQQHLEGTPIPSLVRTESERTDLATEWYIVWLKLQF